VVLYEIYSKQAKVRNTYVFGLLLRWRRLYDNYIVLRSLGKYDITYARLFISYLNVSRLNG